MAVLPEEHSHGNEKDCNPVTGSSQVSLGTGLHTKLRTLMPKQKE